MRPISETITIDVPRERLIELITDLSIRPAFTDHFLTGFRLERLEPVGVGASARFRLGDSGAWLDTVIERIESPHLVRESGHGGRTNRLPVFTVWELAEGPSPRGTELSFNFWTEPQNAFDKLRNPFGRARRLRRNWRRALRRLQELAESGEAVERLTVAGGDRLPTFVR